MTYDTVLTDTWAAAATSRIVAGAVGTGLELGRPSVLLPVVDPSGAGSARESVDADALRRRALPAVATDLPFSRG